MSKRHRPVRTRRARDRQTDDDARRLETAFRLATVKDRQAGHLLTGPPRGPESVLAGEGRQPNRNRHDNGACP
jgi:hypothetical protein